jgi:hypothetical protein
MAYTEVKNDSRRTIATIRTHGRTGNIEVDQRRRWTREEARLVADALSEVAAEPAPFEITDMGEPVNNPGRDEVEHRPSKAWGPVNTTINNGTANTASGWKPPATVPEALPEGPERPPTQGRGSSRKAWTEYAKANKVPVTSDMSRDDIVRACEAALPTV